ncbi:MAG: hypothetical protein JHC26_08545 [Thermofilum sp.]|uniref:hypothetical protein n=1 Tax=Thermofilum sp. TaxID=1961369 RepID=UPI00258F5764|nr:hypothetical protein [Thermofilum sp.]MCI4409125.1 hypothetical protein [Thermofilum sp.]
MNSSKPVQDIEAEIMQQGIKQINEVERLRELVGIYDDIQKSRISMGNRLGCKRVGGKWVCKRLYTECEDGHKILLKEGKKRDKCPICGKPVKIVEEVPSEELVNIFERLVKTEKEIEALISNEVLKFPEFTKFLVFIKGIGAVIGAKLIAYLYPKEFEFNVNKARAFSGLAVMFVCPKCGYWYYAGKSSNGMPAVPSNEGWKCPVDGTKLVGTSAKGVPYSRKAKALLLGVLPRNLIMNGGIYAKLIKKFEEEVKAKHPDWPKLKVKRTAIRKAVSLLLAQYFAMSLHYRKGVPLPEAYKVVLGKVYDMLKKHEDFITAPIVDYYVDVKSDKYKQQFERVIKELGINKEEVVEWLKKKRVIE